MAARGNNSVPLPPVRGALRQNGLVAYAPQLQPADATGAVYDNHPSDWRRALRNTAAAVAGPIARAGLLLDVDYGMNTGVHSIVLHAAECVGAEVRLFDDRGRTVWLARVVGTDDAGYAQAEVLVPPEEAPEQTEAIVMSRTLEAVTSSGVRYVRLRAGGGVAVRYVGAVDAAGVLIAPAVGSMTQDYGWTSAPQTQPADVTGAVIDDRPEDWRRLLTDDATEAAGPHLFSPTTLELDYGAPRDVRTVTVRTGDPLRVGWRGSTVQLLGADRIALAEYVIDTLTTADQYDLRIVVVPPPALSTGPADDPATVVAIPIGRRARRLHVSRYNGFNLLYLAARNAGGVRYQPVAGYCQQGDVTWLPQTNPSDLSGAVYDSDERDWRAVILNTEGRLVIPWERWAKAATVDLDYGVDGDIADIVVRGASLGCEVTLANNAGATVWRQWVNQVDPNGYCTTSPS